MGAGAAPGCQNDLNLTYHCHNESATRTPPAPRAGPLRQHTRSKTDGNFDGIPPLHHVAAAVALAALSATGAQAQGVVNALCSTDAPWCEAAAKEFTRKTGIKVNQAHKGTGEIAAQLGAEAKNLFKIFSES